MKKQIKIGVGDAAATAARPSVKLHALHLASSRRCFSFATFDDSFIKKALQFSSMDMIKP